MKIEFSASARKDLINVVNHISKDNPKAATDWVEKIKQAVFNLGEFPRLGRIVPEFSVDNLREIIKGNYRIVYKIDFDKDTIVIVAVHHSKKRMV